MLNVTFLTGEYPPMQGGIADHIAYLSQYLAPLEVASTILITRRWQDTRPEVQDLSQISPAQVEPVLSSWGWRCWPEILRFLQTRRPDVLHIQYQAAAFDLGGWVNWLPWFLKKRNMPTPIVTTFHDLRVPYIFPKAGPFRRRSMLALARHSDAVICTNGEDLHILQNTFNRPDSLTSYSLLPTPFITFIPLGSNADPQPPANFNRNTWRQKYQVAPNSFLLAYFGFLNESKGGEELITALALLRQQGIDAHLLLIGGDVGHADPSNVAYAKKVQALIDSHHLANVVHRTGYVELPEVSAGLLAADVVVMPYRDGVSFRRTTLIAALRHGCPVVSTTPGNESLIPEIRPGKNMLLVPPENAPALAQTIVSLVGNEALQQKLAQGAKQLGSLFEWERIAQQTADLYKNCVKCQVPNKNSARCQVPGAK